MPCRHMGRSKLTAWRWLLTFCFTLLMTYDVVDTCTECEVCVVLVSQATACRLVLQCSVTLLVGSSARKIVPKVTYDASSGMLNTTVSHFLPCDHFELVLFVSVTWLSTWIMPLNSPGGRTMQWGTMRSGASLVKEQSCKSALTVYKHTSHVTKAADQSFLWSQKMRAL